MPYSYYAPDPPPEVQALQLTPVDFVNQVAAPAAGGAVAADGAAPAAALGGYGAYVPLAQDVAIEAGLNALDVGAADRPRTVAEWEQLLEAYRAAAGTLELGGNYRYEKEDAKHRMGDLLGVAFALFRKRGLRGNFIQWLDSIPEWERITMIANAEEGASFLMWQPQAPVPGRPPPNPANRTLSPSMVKAFVRGVRYFDKPTRKQHRVKFVAGRAMYNGALFSTLGMETVFSGAGYAIWVIGNSGKMYAGNHVKGQLHHSSFLAGAGVKCGGEMYATNGQIELLSAKTGHYQADTANLAWTLAKLGTVGIDAERIKVLVWPAVPNGQRQGPAKIVTGRRFLSHINQYVAWGRPTGPELMLLRARQFDRFPST